MVNNRIWLYSRFPLFGLAMTYERKKKAVRVRKIALSGTLLLAVILFLGETENLKLFVVKSVVCLITIFYCAIKLRIIKI